MVIQRNIEIIGEAARWLPQDIKDRYEYIEWSAIIGMRNIIAHQYFGIDIDIIWTTLKTDFLILKTQLEKILR